MDDEDNLKRRARRRLIGAVTLTTVIVLILPMLLDSEPKLVGPEIELSIPDKDKIGEFESDLTAPPIVEPVSATSGVENVAASEVASTDANASSPASGTVAPQLNVTPASAPSQAVGKENAESVPPLKTQQPAPEVKIPPSFVVQIGAFSNVDSARQLQKKLSKLGIKVYTEKVKDKTRVRAGPFATREAADKVRHKLEAQGLHPVVSPAP